MRLVVGGGLGTFKINVSDFVVKLKRLAGIVNMVHLLSMLSPMPINAWSWMTISPGSKVLAAGAIQLPPLVFLKNVRLIELRPWFRLGLPVSWDV